jgi:hypothetical protein
VHPHGGYKRVWPEDAYRLSRSGAKRAAEREREEPRHRSSKDTKRWCRGVVGREHEWADAERRYGHRVVLYIQACRRCRKERGREAGRRARRPS